MTKMYNVSFEIYVNGDNPLDVAKEVQSMIQEGDNWQFYVQDAETKQLYSVDLQEEDKDAVLEIKLDDYSPIINK